MAAAAAGYVAAAAARSATAPPAVAADDASAGAVRGTAGAAAAGVARPGPKRPIGEVDPTSDPEGRGRARTDPAIAGDVAEHDRMSCGDADVVSDVAHESTEAETVAGAAAGARGTAAPAVATDAAAAAGAAAGTGAGTSVHVAPESGHWASSCDDDDSEDDDKGSEDSMDEDPAVRGKAVDSGRDQWTKKVDQIRVEDMAAYQLQNTANYASLDMGPEPKPSPYVMIFPQDQSENGTERFMRRRGVKKLLRHLKPLKLEHMSIDVTRPPLRIAYWISLKFVTKGLAKLAHSRILEEQKGGDWPPFAVVFASPRLVHSMESPTEDSTPGAAV
jgi:hypothetical protein